MIASDSEMGLAGSPWLNEWMQISYFYSPNPWHIRIPLPITWAMNFMTRLPISILLLVWLSAWTGVWNPLLCYAHLGKWSISSLVSLPHFHFLVLFFFFYVSYVKYPSIAVRVRFQYGKYLGTVCTQESGMKERWFMGYIINMDSVLIYHVKALA